MSECCVRIINTLFYLNDSGLSIVSKDKELQQYINYYLLSDTRQEYIYNNCTFGSIQRNLNMGIFYKLKIPIPTLPKNKKLIENLEPLFQNIEKLQTKLKDAELEYNKVIKELASEAIPTNK